MNYLIYIIYLGANYGGAWDGWYGPDGRGDTYDYELVYQSDAGVALDKIGMQTTKEKIASIR